MKTIIAILAIVTLFVFSSIAQADVFNLGSASDGTALTNLEMVTVGDPGNTGELSGYPNG